MFKLHSEYKPTGDQPKAIEYLSKRNPRRKEISDFAWCNSVLGKTFTMANIIEKVQKPTLVLAHNKTLARTTLQRVQGVLSRERSRVFCFLL